MPRQFRILLLTVVALCNPESEAISETLRSGYPLMMEIADARLLAMGGAALSESGEAGNVTHNPASLYSSPNFLSASYARHPVEIWSGRLMAGRQLKNYNTSIYLQSYGYGTMERTGSNSNGSFNAGEYLLGAAFAGNLIANLNWGVGGKLGWYTIEDVSGAAMAFDAGVTFDPQWEKFKLGLVLRNWGSELKGDDANETPTPTELAFSVSKRLAHLPLTLHTVLNLRRKGEGDLKANFLPGEPDLSYAVGGEFEISPANAEKPIKLRFGYRSIGDGLRVGNGGDTFAGFSFGLGLIVRRFAFDYAYAPLGALGYIHRIGISRQI